MSGFNFVSFVGDEETAVFPLNRVLSVRFKDDMAVIEVATTELSERKVSIKGATISTMEFL